MKNLAPFDIHGAGNRYGAVGGLILDDTDQHAIRSCHPDSLRHFWRGALQAAHTGSVSIAQQLTFRPGTRAPGMRWIACCPHHTPEIARAGCSSLVDTLMSLSGTLSLESSGTVEGTDLDWNLETGGYTEFTEFIQYESCPAPREPQQGLDYFYCLHPFDFSSMVQTRMNNRLAAPSCRQSWALEIRLDPTELSRQETDVLPQILRAIEPFASDRRVKQVSELTGTVHTETIAADPGAVLCFKGFSELYQRVVDQPVFILSLRLFTADSNDRQILSNWIQNTVLGSQKTTVLTDRIDSEPGQQVVLSRYMPETAYQIASSVWKRADAPAILRRFYRIIAMDHGAVLLSHTQQLAAAMTPESVPAPPPEPVAAGTPTGDLNRLIDESLYNSLYLDRFGDARSGIRETGDRIPDHTGTESSPLPARYKILSNLGSGGMGDVFLVYDRELDREFAVKILKAGLNGHPDRVKQFKTEVSLTQDLVHEAIVRMHHLDTFNNCYYCVMEYVTGESLAHHLAGLSTGMDMENARYILIQLCEAMAVAHNRSIIHRDLKPGNVMLTESNRIKILDFGLACLRSNRAAALTGSLGYIAPEILNGLPADERSDVFSAGVIGYQMLTLKKPGGVVDRDLGLGDRINPDLAAAIIDAMHTDPDRRIQSMKDFSERLFDC
jgi:hypothetical protein